MANVTSQFAGLLGLANREELLPVYEGARDCGCDCAAAVDACAARSRRHDECERTQGPLLLLPLLCLHCRPAADVKGFVCCAVPDTFASMWIGLTFAGAAALTVVTGPARPVCMPASARMPDSPGAHPPPPPRPPPRWATHAGVFAFALIFCTFWYIGKIDRAPRTDCCGCTCHTSARYAGTVYPQGDRLPQYSTGAGFEGAYDAPLAPISGLGGGGEGFAQVVVQAPGSVPKKLDGGY